MLAALLATGCGGSDKPTALGSIGARTATPAVSATPSATRKPAARPAPAPPAPKPPRAARARAAKLPLAQQVGQLFLVGFEGSDLQGRVFGELRGHGWGGIAISADNAPTLAGYGLFAREAVAVSRGAGRVPPLVLAQGDVGPLHLGSTPANARSAARSAAARLKAQGITLAVEPTVDVGVGANPGLVARVAPAAVGAWSKAGVAPAPAHFPGQGAASQEPLDGPATVGLSRVELARRDLRPFRTALRRAPAVTVSSASYTAYDPVTPAALVPGIVRRLLRRVLRFRGVAMTDDVSALATATGESRGRAAVLALKAGIDLVYVPEPAQRSRAYDAVLRAARSGRLPRARVRDAVARVLELKRRAGVR